MTDTSSLQTKYDLTGLRSTSSARFTVPVAILATVLAAQNANALAATSRESESRSSTQITHVNRQLTLADELLRFHQTLTQTQTELPEEAARVLRDNLWRLYA